MEENQIQFKAKIRQDGGSKVFSVPQQLLDFLDVGIGDELVLTGETKKKGKFIAVWKNKNLPSEEQE